MIYLHSDIPNIGSFKVSKVSQTHNLQYNCNVLTKAVESRSISVDQSLLLKDVQYDSSSNKIRYSDFCSYVKKCVFIIYNS